MTDRLTELVQLAEQLARDARPARACLLEYLRLIPLADLRRMPPIPPPYDPVIREVAEKLGDSPLEVQSSLGEFFRLDVGDYSDFYTASRRFFDQHLGLAGEAARFVHSMFPAPQVSYSLQGSWCTWNPENLTLRATDVEGVDYGKKDEQFWLTIRGYLVSQGMAFGSSVEMLAASFYDNWPGWDELWDRYYGWSEHWG